VERLAKCTDSATTSETHSSITDHADKWHHRQLDQSKSLERSDSLDKLIEKKKPEWDKFMHAFLSSPEKKGIFLDLDGTLAHFSGKGERVKVSPEVIEIINQITNKGHCVAIITGRSVAFVRRLLEQTRPNDKDIKSIEISGEYGATHQGPSTNGREKTREDLENYTTIGKSIIDTIESYISKDDDLRDKIKISPKILGGTVHHKGLREKLEVLSLQDKTIDINKEIYTTNIKAAILISEVLASKKEYGSFYQEDTNLTGINLLLDKKTTGIEVSKATVVDTLVKKLGLVSVLAAGDDLPDLVMQKRLQELAISADSPLKNQAFLGVRHINPERMPIPPAIEDDSTALIAGPDQVAQLLSHIAKNIKPYDVKH
jgi:HAD superfamily hydrolase (TIGR01484 family)